MKRKNTTAPPSQAQQQHAAKIVHRRSDGRFKPPPGKQPKVKG